MWELEVQERKISYDRVPLADRRLCGLDPVASVTANGRTEAIERRVHGKARMEMRHESSSPEPEDPNEMEFTPSKLEALDLLPPPMYRW